MQGSREVRLHPPQTAYGRRSASATQLRFTHLYRCGYRELPIFKPLPSRLAGIDGLEEMSALCISCRYSCRSFCHLTRKGVCPCVCTPSLWGVHWGHPRNYPPLPHHMPSLFLLLALLQVESHSLQFCQYHSKGLNSLVRHKARPHNCAKPHQVLLPFDKPRGTKRYVVRLTRHSYLALPAPMVRTAASEDPWHPSFPNIRPKENTPRDPISTQPTIRKFIACI